MKVDSRMGTAVDDVRYRLLGPMEVCVDGAPVKLPGTAERALLAQLLLSPGRTIPATMLVDRLWSESTLPVDPMNALQIRVSKLRRALKAMGVGDVVTREGVGYRATIDPSTVDALDFADRIRTARAAAANAADNGGIHPAHVQAYDDALALWRGDPLSDFAAELWATAEAARLTELRLAAMTERAQVALALGRHLEVIGDLEPVVAHDPTLESLAGLLMLALYRSGRQADALDVYTRTREVLDESLGLEPSVSLRSLHERVLRQDATLGAQQDMVPAAASTAAATAAVIDDVWRAVAGRLAAQRTSVRSRCRRTGPAPTRTARRRRTCPPCVRPLIGRDAQLDSIAELLGGVRLLSLIGPGGAGKTSLALATVVRDVGELPRRCLRGAAGVGQHPRPGAGRGRRRPRHADGWRRRDPRPARPAHLVPDPAPHAAAGRQLRARRGCRRRPHRRHPQPLPRHHRHRHQPRSARHPRRGAGHRRPVGDATGGHPARARCSATRRRSCSPNGPAPCAPGCCSTPTTCPRSVPSAGPSTASHSPSSSPPPGCRRCRRSRCPNGSRTGSPCSPPAPAPPKTGSRRCAPPSTGATSCCRRPSNGCSTGSRSSRAVGR